MKWEMFSLTDNGDNPNILQAKLFEMNYHLVFNEYPLILITVLKGILIVVFITPKKFLKIKLVLVIHVVSTDG